jgi:hypothetical protein
LAELSVNWEKYAEFLDSFELPKTSTDRAYIKSLKAYMASAETRAIIVIANDLCSPAGPLICKASMEARLIPVDFWSTVFAWVAALRRNYDVVERYVDGVTKNIPGVTSDMRVRLQEEVQNAIACAMDKPTRHLLADNPAADDLPLEALRSNIDTLRHELAIFNCRECFNIGQPLSLPAADNSAAIWDWMTKATNKDPPPAEFRSAFELFLEKKERGTLPAQVPPPPQDPFSKSDAEALVKFWRTIKADASLRRVGEAALRALTVAYSQTVVERQFSVMSNLEIDNRLHAGPRYITNMLFLRCNGPFFDEYITARLAVLGTAGL